MLILIILILIILIYTGIGLIMYGALFAPNYPWFVYKVVAIHPKDDRYTSAVVTYGPFSITYELNKEIGANNFMKQRNHHIFAFTDLHAAKRYQGALSGISAVLKCKYNKKDILPLPEFYDPYELINGEIKPGVGMSFPKNTIHLKQLIPIKVV
jgi:hypothetical protein